MTEAARRVLRYGFEELGLDFFVCAHFAGNERSRRVIEKCGFRPLGTDLYKTRIGTVEENHFYVLDNPARKGLWP
jgi:ribosomal-protein-alanine N-acetyltransferase